jgi:NDP-sugar pyrophosphorylase family protein
MIAVILCGGKGSRMGSMTKTLPKSMLDINGKPLLQYQIELLYRYSFTDIILCTGFLSEAIEEYFKDGSAFGVNIRYSIDRKPLGTAGAVKHIGEDLTESLLILYGDVFVAMNLRKLIDFHRSSKGAATLVLHPSDHPHDSDIVKVDQNNEITGFIHKPAKGSTFENLTSAALYVIESECLEFVPEDRPFDFGRDLFPRLMKAGKKLYGYITDEYLKDIGTSERYQEVVRETATRGLI